MHRAVAESATNTYTYVAHLTYRQNADGTTPDGAKVFKYTHVQNLLRKIRRTAAEAQAAPKLRYLSAGEQGSDNKRVHYHLVIYTNFDLGSIGKWTDVTGKPEPMRPERSQIWDHWPHGHLKIQIPDEGGIRYALKYALKDCFSSQKSKGTLREAKSEPFAAGHFRMSKKPPIGTDYLVERIRDWRQRGQLPIDATLSVPQLTGYWRPVGEQRKLLLNALGAINREHKFRSGRDLPQWAVLFSAIEKCGPESSDFENLVYEVTQDDAQDTADQIVAERQQAEAKRRLLYARKRCGGPFICALCTKSQTHDQYQEYDRWLQKKKDRHTQDCGPRATAEEFDTWYRAKHTGPNPFCANRDNPTVNKGCGA